jgi:hypothetical protein
MSLLHPSLVAGPLLLIVGIPILIHLIQLLRHRRVKWAAMEFLLQSQKKYRKWILLKQLLLLLLRMGALAVLLFVLAQPVLHGTWGQLVGETRTHHLVLLDDSFSMADRHLERNAFDLGRRFVQQLVDRAEQQPTRHSLSLVRFSRARGRGGEARFDFLHETINEPLKQKLEQWLGATPASQTDAGPSEAIRAVLRQAGPPKDEQRHIYLVSDFRRKDWEDAAALRTMLVQLATAGTRLHLVHCADAERSNLALAGLSAVAGTQAAGVEIMVEVTVKNFGRETARDVAVRLEEDSYARPAVVLDEIPPGESRSRNLGLLLSTAGQHTLSASIPMDAVAADNERYLVLDVADELPVLLVDGDPAARDAYFLATALSPGGGVKTGLKPRIEPVRFLRNHDELQRFSAIYLLNIDYLDDSEVTALERYVQSGGGVGFFLGERCSPSFFNKKLYRGGQGLFPLPLSVPTDLLVERVEKSPDLVVSDHPVFAVFAGERNSFLAGVLIHRYFSLLEGDTDSKDPAVRVIAGLRNGAPLVVEKQYGEGRVVAQLSKVSPEETPQGTWNNWARNNPSFVVAMLELQRYLASPRARNIDCNVGEPLVVRIDAELHESRVQIDLPKESKSDRLLLDAQPIAGALQTTLPETESRGLYRAELRKRDGGKEVRYLAVNVVAEEGNLSTLDEPQLATRLGDLPYQFHLAGKLQENDREVAGVNLSTPLWFVLIGLLVTEQVVAYRASYHLPS